MILRWTLRSLVTEPRATVGSALALAASFTLMLLFRAVWAGEAEQMVAYMGRTDADVWVMQSGVSNMHMAMSFVPSSKLGRVRAVEGVAEATPVLYAGGLLKAPKRESHSYVVGLRDNGRPGGPWELARGRGELKEGEVIVPEVFAELAELDLGDTVDIVDQRLRVVGTSRGTFSMANPVTFVAAADLERILGNMSGYESYFLVTAAAGVEPAALAARIEREVDDVSALTKQEFMDNDRAVAAQMGVELIALLSGIATALGVCVVTFTLYSHAQRRRRELAVLKAVGFRAYHLYMSLGLHAVLLTLLGLLTSVALSRVVVALAQVLVPEVAMLLSAEIVLRSGASGLLVALVASLLVARKVARVAPQLVFQG